MPLNAMHLAAFLRSLKVVSLRYCLFRSTRRGAYKRLIDEYTERACSATTDVFKQEYGNIQL